MTENRRTSSGAAAAACQICASEPATEQEPGGRWVCAACGKAVRKVADRLGPTDRERIFPTEPEDLIPERR